MNLLCVLFLIFGVVVGFAVFIQFFMFSISGENLTIRLRTRLFTKMITQDMSWYDESANSTGALCSQLSSDAASIKGATGSRLSTVLQALATLLAAIFVSLVYNVKIGLVVLSFIPLLLVGYYFESRINSGQILNEKNAVQRASKIAIDAIQNIRTIASLHLEEEFKNQYMSALRRPHIQAKKHCHISGLVYGLANAIPWFAHAAALFYGSALIQSGELFYGDLFKITEGVFAGSWIMGFIVAYAPDYDKAKVSAVRIFELLDKKPKIDIFSTCGKTTAKPLGAVEFSKVTFRYPSRPEIEVIKSVQIQVDTGKTVALVGSSGCGKSTCMQLMERFYDPSYGEIKLDGIDIKELNVNWLRSQFGLVSQEPVLFCGTIAENIAYGDNSRCVPMEEITEAAKKTNIHSFIQSLPDGYSTDVGAKGTHLSGGQKQRLAIARALVRNPRVLLLDEATSALDNESEMIVQDALDKARKGRTCITIAHRFSSIQNVDHIVVIHKGEIVEQGTHKELFSLRGHYYKLYSKQDLKTD